MLPSVKRWGIISATILFYLLWIQLELSLIFHYVNLPIGEVLMTFCVSTLTLKGQWQIYASWFMSSLVKTVVWNICGAKPLSKPVESRYRRVISSFGLSQGPLQCLHIHYQSNETSTDIKDSKFVDHLYIDWPLAKQQYASKANAVGLSYRD